MATSSSESVTNIQKMLSSLMEKINAGVTAITAAGQAFSGIAAKVQENAEMVGNIYAAMEEQRAGANDTQKFTLEILNSVQEVKSLAEKETRQAEALREFMQTVVDASLSTENAIQDSLAATTDLQQSITLVDGSASVNQKVVGKIQNQVAQFKL
ncbi:MAG: hypothetical protein MJ162_07075 [Treponema sp.]|nr:hypothetical protein [Treponema sp.]